MNVRLDCVTSLKPLGCVELLYIDGNDVVHLRTAMYLSDQGRMGYEYYSYHLYDGVLELDRHSAKDIIRFRDSLRPASSQLKVFLSRLLDGSVDSKQLTQGLKAQGIDVTDLKVFKSYLGGWRVIRDAGEQVIITPLLYMLHYDHSWEEALIDFAQDNQDL